MKNLNSFMIIDFYNNFIHLNLNKIVNTVIFTENINNFQTVPIY